MFNPITDVKKQINTMLIHALEKAAQKGDLPTYPMPTYVVEIPSNAQNGDFATNLAMASAKTARMAPIKIANAIVANLNLENSMIDHCEIAGPGFINFFLKKEWYETTVKNIVTAANDYGHTNTGNGQKVMVEFVSANPTGPMHIGNARGGALGDCLAACLDWAGYDVCREFYINDAGNQIEKFGLSLEARYLQIFKGEENVPFPDDGYMGDDIRVHAKCFADVYGDRYVSADSKERQQALIDFALPKNIAGLKNDLAKYRIHYDVWFHESVLHNDGTIQKIISILEEKGLTFEKDGALWYKASQFGGEKDEVLIRANGHPTYFAADIAYHYNKFVQRGFDKVINIWGADHHGHVARLKGAMDAIGVDSSRLDIVLMQLVRLMKDGHPVKMSKRTGKMITLSDLIDEVPVDAARFFFNLREPNSTLDFDLDLAVEQSQQNPVYYTQYAHARICSIIKNLAAEGISIPEISACNLSLLTEEDELQIIRKLARFPSEIADAAQNYDPARITHYAVETATLFHRFYNNCRVKNENIALMNARIVLCMATKIVLHNALSLLKIDAPEIM